MKRTYQVRYINDWYQLERNKVYECELFIEERDSWALGKRSWCIVSGDKKGKIFMFENGIVENDFVDDIPKELFEI
jgi:hypothetical protein